MGIWTLLVMFLLVFQLKYAEAQINPIFEARNTSFTLHSFPSATNANLPQSFAISPALNPRPVTIPKAGYLPMNHCKPIEWSTFSLRFNNSNTGDDWLNEHNMVMVKSLIRIADRLIVGINCHYNLCFTVAGNGAGIVLNKLPIKIYFAGVMGGAPDLEHR